jgi:mannose-6-phosphate isomerase-like protein (cupin superfamily)
VHHHPYDETVIILEGQVLVRVGDQTLEGGPRRHRRRPGLRPARLHQPQPGRARLVCIHAAPAMTTGWLD